MTHTVHVVTEFDDCVPAEAMKPVGSTSVLLIDGVPHTFDREARIVGSWHFADPDDEKKWEEW